MPDTPTTLSLPSQQPKKRGRKLKQDIQLDMEHISDIPKLPTQEELDRYERWLNRNKPRPIEEQQHDIQRRLNNRWSWRQGPLQRRKYFLSDEAKTNLFKLATRYKYARDVGTGNHQSISPLVRALADPQIKWVDNRPSETKDYDEELLTQKLLPIWLLPDQYTRRYAREVYVTQTTEQVLYQLALAHAILDRTRPDPINKTKVVSFLLEVIGHNLLVPQGIPDNPNPVKKPYFNPIVDRINY